MTLPPYADLLGATIEGVEDDSPVLIMPFDDSVTGRPGFVQGGAIAGLLEVAAIAALQQALAAEGGGRIKPINVTVDYMRGGRDKPTRTRDRHAARQSRRQCRGGRLAGRARAADRGGTDELSDRARLSAAAPRFAM